MTQMGGLVGRVKRRVERQVVTDEVLVCWAVRVGWGWRVGRLDRMDGRL